MYIILFAIRVTGYIYSQPFSIEPLQYRVVHWDLKDGLGKERWHNGLLKDHCGFLWVGSSHGELSRFDGNTYRQFSQDKGKFTFGSYSCQSLLEDSTYNIWVGTTNALYRLDLFADTIETIRQSTNVSGPSFIPFGATKNEVFCIEGNSDLVSYNIHNLSRKKLWQIKQTDGLSQPVHGLSYTIYHSGTNSFWMLPSDKEGLVQISLNQGKELHYDRPLHNQLKVNQHTRKMCYDKIRDCIWLNCEDGLVQFSLKDFKFYPIDALKSIVNRETYTVWGGIDIDKTGKVWFARTSGIMVYDPDSYSYFYPVKDLNLNKEVASGNLKIYCADDGNVWLSCWKAQGIYQLMPYQRRVHRYDLQTNHIFPLGNNNLLFNCSDGFGILDITKGSSKKYDRHSFSGLFSENIIPMTVDTIHHIAFFNSYYPDRVYKLDLITFKYDLIVLKDSSDHELLPVNIVNYLSAPFRDGILFYDEGYGIFELKRNSLVAKKIINRLDGFEKLEVVDSNLIFLWTPKNEYNVTFKLVDGQWIRTAHPMDSLKWIDFMRDDNDTTYWVSISNEIIHFDGEFKIIRSYKNDQGVIGNAFSLIRDDRGNIWFLNDRRKVSYFNITSGLFTTLSENDGYKEQSYDIFTGYNCRIANHIFFSGLQEEGSNSLISVNTDEISTIPPSQVYFNSIKINDAPLDISTGVNIIYKLNLPYYKNSIAIQAGIINHFSKGIGSLKFKWEKNGKEGVWQYAPYYHTITYNELAPGRYTLRLMASNAASEFNGPEKKLEILIGFPFWTTWWFRIIVIGVILGGTASIMYWWFRHLFHQKLKVQLVRQKIAADLHDEIGSNLSSMTFAAELVKRKLNGSRMDIDPILNQLISSIRENSTLISDTIWSLNPQNESFEKLVDRLRNFAHEMLSAKEMNYKFDTSALAPISHLSLEQMRDINLVFKEAIHNISKHSYATLVKIKFESLPDKLSIEIQDNGKGFEMDETYQGTGLNNFKIRSGHSCIIQYSSVPSEGTLVRLLAFYQTNKDEDQNRRGKMDRNNTFLWTMILVITFYQFAFAY